MPSSEDSCSRPSSYSPRPSRTRAPTVAIRAARATLETGLKANDMRDYKRRLDLLDDAFALST